MGENMSALVRFFYPNGGTSPYRYDLVVDKTQSRAMILDYTLTNNKIDYDSFEISEIERYILIGRNYLRSVKI